MPRKPFRLLTFPVIVLLASFSLSIPKADAAATYSVRDFGLTGLNIPIEAANIGGRNLLTYKNGEMVWRGNPSATSPPPPAGMGNIVANSFTSPNGEWRVGTAYAAPVGQPPWRGYIQSATSTEERVFDPITNLEHAGTSANAVNDSGVAVGGASGWTGYPDGRAVRFNADGTTTMLGTTGNALGISNSGLIVGSTIGAVGIHGFLYDSGQIIDLNQFVPPNLGLDIVTATDVFDNGQIVAFGKDGSGFYHELLLTPDSDPPGEVENPVVTDPQPVPEPSSALVFGVIAIAALALRRRIGRNAV